MFNQKRPTIMQPQRFKIFQMQVANGVWINVAIIIEQNTKTEVTNITLITNEIQSNSFSSDTTTFIGMQDLQILVRTASSKETMHPWDLSCSNISLLGSSFVATSPFYIGSRSNTDGFFVGFIDEVETTYLSYFSQPCSEAMSSIALR